MAQKLSFHARGTACVPDPHGTEATPQRRRMVGRKHQEVSPGTWAWISTGKADELPMHNDLVKATKDGDLWPADAETAKACGVEFDPTFGGEVTETIQSRSSRRSSSPTPTTTSEAGAAGEKGAV